MTVTGQETRRSRRASFEAKLLFVILAILMAILVPLLYFQMAEQRSNTLVHKIEQFRSVSRAVALTYGGRGKPSELAVVARRIRRDVPEFSYLVLEDTGGHVLFDSRSGKSHHALEIAGPTGFIAVEPVSDHGRPVGTLRFGFSMVNVEYSVANLRAWILAIFGLTAILGILLSIYLSRSISRPVRALIKCSQEVAAGNLQVSVPIDPKDELGDLCANFNTMIVSLREAHEKLIRRINRDTLTDLHNHRYFQEQLQKEIARAERQGSSLYALMIDVDHFKRFNDAYGHPKGDIAIKEIARVIGKSVRSSDTAARYGGEEFAVIVVDTDVQGAVAVAERIRSGVEDLRNRRSLGEEFALSVSIGIAGYPEHSKERDGLIIAADLAMYRAKHTGRNRICSFESVCEAPESTDPHQLYLLLDEANLSTIEALAAAVDAKDPHTHGHSQSVARYAVGLAEALGLSQVEQDNVRIAGLLHDVGKIGIPDQILNKPGYLTNEERKLIEGHPCLGDAIIRKVPRLASIRPGILHHHERYDGNGYPSKLQGNEIPLVARIITLADSFDALTSDRPYRRRFSQEQALEMLQEGAGTQFDPELVERFVRMLRVEDELSKAA